MHWEWRLKCMTWELQQPWKQACLTGMLNEQLMLRQQQRRQAQMKDAVVAAGQAQLDDRQLLA